MVKTIVLAAEQLTRRFQTRDPFEAAGWLGINVWERDLGNIKGFYNVINRERYIVINERLDESEKRCICAHELGHDRLHRAFAQYTPMQDHSLYDMSRKPEREANLFGAAFLIDEADITANRDYTVEQLAALLRTSEDYIRLKLEIIKRFGRR